MSSSHDPDDDAAADGIDQSDPHHERWHRRASLRNPENEERPKGYKGYKGDQTTNYEYFRQTVVFVARVVVVVQHATGPRNARAPMAWPATLPLSAAIFARIRSLLVSMMKHHQSDCACYSEDQPHASNHKSPRGFVQADDQSHKDGSKPQHGQRDKEAQLRAPHVRRLSVATRHIFHRKLPFEVEPWNPQYRRATAPE